MDEIEKLFNNAENAVRYHEYSAALYCIIRLLKLLAKANAELYKFHLEQRKRDATGGPN